MELDSFGVINNAVYQNYLEHTRHQFLESQGLKLTAYFEHKLSPVILKAEIEYRSPLQSRDYFVVSLELALLCKVKLIFLQKIRSIPNKTLILCARKPEPTLILLVVLFYLLRFKTCVLFLLPKQKTDATGVV